MFVRGCVCVCVGEAWRERSPGSVNRGFLANHHLSIRTESSERASSRPRLPQQQAGRHWRGQCCGRIEAGWLVRENGLIAWWWGHGACFDHLWMEGGRAKDERLVLVLLLLVVSNSIVECPEEVTGCRPLRSKSNRVLGPVPQS